MCKSGSEYGRTTESGFVSDVQMCKSGYGIDTVFGLDVLVRVR
ncbi:unnamed protein product [Haemonchus placei]|uniref:Conserved domain protein n=1 Tax=Haemonchus placei TaxID=6290 RepID=A0A0N4VVC4_HAEPC|nr:unnamed protein product [Haemonchus placei]